MPKFTIIQTYKMQDIWKNVDDWNNDKHTTTKYYYSDYRVMKVSE